MTPHDGLLVHSQPVNRTAALHVAGGDQLDREELLWAQHEAFERAITDARLHNMERDQKNRREFVRKANRHKLRYRDGINQKLDHQIQNLMAERLRGALAPAPAGPHDARRERVYATKHPNPGPMRRRNEKRYGSRRNSVEAALGVFNEVLKQKA